MELNPLPGSPLLRWSFPGPAPTGRGQAPTGRLHRWPSQHSQISYHGKRLLPQYDYDWDIYNHCLYNYWDLYNYSYNYSSAISRSHWDLCNHYSYNYSYNYSPALYAHAYYATTTTTTTTGISATKQRSDTLLVIMLRT